MRRRALELQLGPQVLAALALALSSGAASSQEAPNAEAGASSPAESAPVVRAGSSDSGDMKSRLRFRVERALGESGPRLGAPGGYNWVFLVQVAAYKDSDARFTNMRRGMQAFLDDLIASRRGLAAAQVSDTVSILPYHFNILGAPRERKVLLRDFLSDATPLKQKVPGQPQDDTYGDGKPYRDGHDWRLAMGQTLEWMRREDMAVQNSVVVVLDWNDLAQAPRQDAEGRAATPSSKYLVQPANTALWKQFGAKMQAAGLPARNLETVQVGNLEYDMAVFTRADLRPLNAAAATTPTPEATEAGQCTDGQVYDEAQGKCVPAPAPASFPWPLLLLAIPVGFGVSRMVVARGVKINGKNFAMKATGPTSVVEILGVGGRAKSGQLSYTLPEEAAPAAPASALARLSMDWRGKVSVTKGAYEVKPLNGFKAASNGAVEMTDARGTFSLHDSSGQHVTNVNVQKG